MKPFDSFITRAAAAALAVSAALWSGCASSTGMPTQPWKSADELAVLQPYLTADVVATYHAKAVGAPRTAYRDEVVYARLRAIDISYSEFVTNVAKERNLEAVGTDVAVLALTGTASLIKPTTTKSILAAISGGVVGVKGSIDKNLFYDKTMPVLLTQMEALRKQQLATILAGLNHPADRYSLTQALIDLHSYFQAGTIPYALVAINAASGVSSKAASEEIKGLKLVSRNYGAAEDQDVVVKIQHWLLNGGSTWDTARRHQLDGWLAEKKIADGGITDFLSGPFKAERRAFVTETKIQ